MDKIYDVIVVGLGAMGSSTACQSAKRGLRVLGLEALQQGHNQGSSHGSTRAIRESYFEAADYVPLVQRSYQMWRDIEQAAGQDLMKLRGALYLAPDAHPLLNGIKTAALEHNLRYTEHSPKQLSKQFPGFVIPDGWKAIFESRGGLIQSDLAQRLQIDMASNLGADIKFKTQLKSWQQNDGYVTVETSNGTYKAGHLVLTLGPWAIEQLAPLGLPLKGRKITVVTFNPAKPKHYSRDDFSVYFWATPEGIFAGFPHVDGEGIKIMRHDTGDECTPDTIDRQCYDSDVNQLIDFTQRHMPGVNGGINNKYTCMYTITPDNHFVIDQLDNASNITFATGFSGHGFKFAPVIGEILTDFVQHGKTEHPIDFLGANRFA